MIYFYYTMISLTFLLNIFSISQIILFRIRRRLSTFFFKIQTLFYLHMTIQLFLLYILLYTFHILLLYPDFSNFSIKYIFIFQNNSFHDRHSPIHFLKTNTTLFYFHNKIYFFLLYILYILLIYFYYIILFHAFS